MRKKNPHQKERKIDVKAAEKLILIARDDKKQVTIIRERDDIIRDTGGQTCKGVRVKQLYQCLNIVLRFLHFETVRRNM